jgi:hypothetical protein
MNVRELIEILEDADEDATVLLAHQPSWPLQFTVAGVYDPAETPAECDRHGIAYEPTECAQCDELTDDRNRQDGGVVYIVEGSHPDHPYAPRQAWDNPRRY